MPYPKLSDAKVTQLVNFLGTGITMDAAAQAVGISRRTVPRWVKAGTEVLARKEAEPDWVASDEEELLARAATSLIEARYRCEATLAGHIVRAAKGGWVTRRRHLPGGGIEEDFAGPDWRAAAFILTHSSGRQERWSQRITVSDPDGSPLGTGAHAASLAEHAADRFAAYLQGREDVLAVDGVNPDPGV